MQRSDTAMTALGRGLDQATMELDRAVAKNLPAFSALEEEVTESARALAVTF